MAAQTQTVDWQVRQYHGRHRRLGRQPPVKSRDVSTVVQGSVNDTGKEPLGPCSRVRQNCPCHGCSPAKESDLDFVFPSVLKRFRRHLLTVTAGCDVCCTLQCSSNGRVWSPFCCPDKGTIVNALVAQIWDVMPVVGQFCDQTLPGLRHLVLLLPW